MKYKLLLFLSFANFYYKANCQTEEIQIPYSVLKTCLEDKLFEKEILNYIPQDTVIIIDLYSCFEDSKTFIGKKKTYIFKNILESEKRFYEKKMHGVLESYKNEIFIFKVEKKNSRYTLYFLQATNGGTVVFEIKHRKQKNKIIKRSYGVF